MRANVVSEASLSTRASQWWSGIPFFTGGAVLVCSTIYIVDLLVGYDSFQQVCFSPDTTVANFQVYRVFTSVLFHASLMHVVFNMLALVPIGSALERVMGSVRYLHLLLLTAVTNALIHLAVAYVVAYNPLYAYPDVITECQIGFSGLLFAMIVIESSLYTGQSRSIFGFFNVPAKWYPWVLLIIFQFLMPRVSLLGHLSGILSGFAYVYGCLNIFLLSQATYSKIESSSLCALCMRRPGFLVSGGSSVTGPLPSFNTTTTSTTSNSGLGDAWRNLRASMAPRTTTEPTADQRFPGQPRTLGSEGPLRTPHRTPPPQRTSQRSSQRQSADSNADLEARLLEDDDLELVEAPPVSTGGVGALPARSTNTTSPTRTNQASTPPADKEAALRSLVAMGFEQSQARVALNSSSGDITTAVEILSSQHPQQ